MVKDFNTGKVCSYDIMPTLYRYIYTKGGRISKDFYYLGKDFKKKKITSKKELKSFVDSQLMYHYWSKCEYEFIVIDWPFRVKENNLVDIDENRPMKIDVYSQVKPNIDLIVDNLWMELEKKINK